MVALLTLSGALRQFGNASYALAGVAVREAFFSGKMRLFTIGPILAGAAAYTAYAIGVAILGRILPRQPTRRDQSNCNEIIPERITALFKNQAPPIAKKTTATEKFSTLLDQCTRDCSFLFEKWGEAHCPKEGAFVAYKELKTRLATWNAEKNQNLKNLDALLNKWRQTYKIEDTTCNTIIENWQKHGNNDTDALKSLLCEWAINQSPEIKNLKDTAKTVAIWSFDQFYAKQKASYIEEWSAPLTYYEKQIKNYQLEKTLETSLIKHFKENKPQEFFTAVTSSGLPQTTRENLVALSQSFQKAHKPTKSTKETLDTAFATKIDNLIATGSSVYKIVLNVISFLTPEGLPPSAESPQISTNVTPPSEDNPELVQLNLPNTKSFSPEQHKMLEVITETLTDKYFQPLINKMHGETNIAPDPPQAALILDKAPSLLVPYVGTVFSKFQAFLSQFSMTRISLTLHCIASELLTCCQAMQVAQKTHGESAMTGSFLIVGAYKDPNYIELTKIGVSEDNAKAIIQKTGKCEIGVDATNILQELQSPYLSAIGNSDKEKEWIQTSFLHLGSAFPQLKPFLSDPQLNNSDLLLSLLESQIASPSLETSILSHITTLGIPHLVQKKGPLAIQQALDKISSTGFMSTTITKALITSSLTLSTDDPTWKELLPFLQLVYSSMTEKDQKYIETHLSYLYSGEMYTGRINDLKNPVLDQNTQKIHTQIQTILATENELASMLESIEKAPKRTEEDSQALKDIYGTLQRQLELKQFEKAKILILHFISTKLAKVAVLRTTGLLDIIVRIIEGVFNLLQYKNVVKHLLFTAIDFLCTEHPETTSSAEDSSIFAILEQQNLHSALEKKALAVADGYNNGGGVTSIIISGLAAIYQWGHQLNIIDFHLWKGLKTNFQNTLSKTPQQVASFVTDKIIGLGEDPSGIAAILVEVLTEFVIDPRPTAGGNP